MTTHPFRRADPRGAPPPHSGTPPTGDTAYPLTDADFEAIARRVHARSGIVMGEAKRSMVVARLSQRLRRLGLPDFAAYVQLLDSPGGGDEEAALITAMTTNVTRFFREPHHFDALARLLPGLQRKAAAGGRVRLWSAGCSTGQEAFSIAATLTDKAPDLCRRDLRILATDIDPAVVDQARTGRYPADSIGPEVPPGFRRHLLQPLPGIVEISPQLRDLVRFEVLNLLDPWPFGGIFDVVFCRNVVIYFDQPTRLALWQRLADRIPPGGTLFIGHSERMDPQLDPLFEPAGITQYRRTARTGTTGPASPPAKAKERNSACRSETP